MVMITRDQFTNSFPFTPTYTRDPWVVKEGHPQGHDVSDLPIFDVKGLLETSIPRPTFNKRRLIYTNVL